jgi:hypothetical protein
VTLSPDRLYQLLPVFHRMRDTEIGEPLRQLLAVVSEQVNAVEEDIARLYDNWFIETCEDWVVPYIGDLIGYTPVHDAGAPSSDVASREGQMLNEALVPRQAVANTLGFRRRKGTLSLLEDLALAVTGWPADAVEFYKHLGWTQHLDHLRLNRARNADLRDGAALARDGGPFDTLARSVDVRRPVSHRQIGRYNIPSVGVFVWRLQSFPITRAPAYCQEADGPQCYSFSVIGNDAPLFNDPRPNPVPPRVTGETNVPGPIGRGALTDIVTFQPPAEQASATYYGEGKSIAVYAPDWPVKGAPQPVPASTVIPADLGNWHYRAQKGKLGLDPVRGRMMFPSGQLPKKGVWVSYRYGFSAAMGGGEYPRAVSQPALYTLYAVAKDPAKKAAFSTINAALDQWRKDQQALGPAPSDPALVPAWQEAQQKLRAAVIEISDSAAYSESLTMALETGEYLQLRGAVGARPVLRMLDYKADCPDALVISGKQGSRFKLDGVVVMGRSVQVSGPDPTDAARAAQGDLCDVTIRHCTLVPGWGLNCGCEPKRPNEPSLEIMGSSAQIRIERSILGAIFVTASEVTGDSVDISLCDSILDATGLDGTAVGAFDLPLAFARLKVMRTTVIGEVHAHAIELAQDSVFLSLIRVGRRQIGCMRFCYVTPGSRTPRRFHCQPDTALSDKCGCATADAKALCRAGEERRVRPLFNSLRYGHPDYCQLALDCASEITTGATDESEMGAFHDLFQPQRVANLRARLDEYTPAGNEAGIFFAS